ncbi:putative tRNA pseudouridine synthase A [Trypanosoma conorhini]|uniref:Putative tRNA pseudouridine synthase A n=1 Tax=Trypanosoma conorhini TaxID=83891 RepID=A0A422NXD3_9TRYP|nr:putative tRNA pseudouridine synthase A [Trypanosoma conorhini]RNF10192.1 putative tRNA pseudouridine synthase A [Trypanosoma conorhini]
MRRLVPTRRVLLATLPRQHEQQRRWESGRGKAVNGGGAAASASAPRRRKMSPAAAELSRSEDVAEREERLDVERHFPAAMSHLKSPLVSSHVAEEGMKRKWREATRVVNADGYAPPRENTDAAASFFNEGSLDIRGKLRKRGACESAPSRKDSASPDVLQLSAGNTRRHGLALAGESNASPADPTIEPEGEEGQGPYGDTPVQLTDMLKERLMELKAEKLREERNDTYLPRRLRLLSDQELQKQLEAKTTQRELAAKTRSAASQGTPTTLADLANEDVGRGGEDGVGQLTMVSAAASNSVAMENIFRRSADFVPGETSHDPLADFARKSLHTGVDRPRTPNGSVYLLRCLPRAGFCSRREALAIIASGQVRVDNLVERNPFRLVRAENNIHVEAHSGRLRFAPPRLWMYHKPAYVIVSRNDVAGRTLITKHARILGVDHLVPVGSLPMRAHGLLLLTNDGELSRLLESPKTMIQQTYLLRVRPAIDPVLAHKLNTEGILVNGKRHKNVEFFVNPAMKSRYSVKVKVRGETMPISHLMQHLGRTVERGGRISFGPFSMSGLPVGSIREVTIPPYYMHHSGAVWKEFVERDWPFFRRQRVSRLRRLSRYRELTPKELEELDNFTYEELKDVLSFESQELKAASEAQQQRMSVRPTLDEQPLPSDFGGDDVDADCASPEEGEILEDITAVV